MSLFGKLDYTEFATVLKSAVAAFGKEGPSGWDQLRMDDIGLHGGDTFTSRNGRGKAIVLEKDGGLIVSFRGTDKLNDLKDYDNISLSKNYFQQFQSLIKAVADYARDGDLSVTFTGISLGGAVANIIASKINNRWGGAFDDARFVGISSSLLTGSKHADLFNFGLQNDAVYHIVPGSWRPSTRETATKYLFSYESHRYFKDDNIDDRLSVHGVGHVSDVVRSLQNVTVASGELLADVLTPHSYVLFDGTREAVNAGRLYHPEQSVLTIVGEDRADRLYGANHHRGGSHIEWIFGKGGNDKILGRNGGDMLYGGDGNDNIKGGDGVDTMFGGNGSDIIMFENHRDRGTGGAGDDRFIVANMLPLNASGDPSQAGRFPARIYIEDFEPGHDTLDLRKLDGNLARKGHQDLHFAGYFQYDASDGLNDLEQGFVNDPRAGSVTIYQDENGDTLVIVNRDGDRNRDLEIVISGSVGNIQGDLLL